MLEFRANVFTESTAASSTPQSQKQQQQQQKQNLWYKNDINWNQYGTNYSLLLLNKGHKLWVIRFIKILKPWF